MIVSISLVRSVVLVILYTLDAGNRKDNIDGILYDTVSAQSEVYIRMLRRVPPCNNVQNAEAEQITTMNEAYGCHIIIHVFWSSFL